MGPCAAGKHSRSNMPLVVARGRSSGLLRIWSGFLALIMAAVSLVPAVTATPLTAREVRVADGTHVPLKLTQFISSETNRPGDPVQLRVARDVTINGAVVIRRGTPA